MLNNTAQNDLHNLNYAVICGVCGGGLKTVRQNLIFMVNMRIELAGTSDQLSNLSVVDDSV